MSAIAGMLSLDGRPVRRGDLERMVNALGQYGGDRTDVIVGDGISLAHTLMRMTPEDRFDRQPLRGARGLLLTADIRLDNRDELLPRIGVSLQAAADWPDSRVLLVAWEKFGDAVWPMLRGPFAAALWDPREHVLTLARDHLGFNVVMWHQSKAYFSFATMPGGLLALGDVPRRLNEEKFADFLVLNHADHTTTIYHGIFRVPPAHIMKVRADGSLRQWRYWSPGEARPIRLKSDEDYAEGLRACLDTAVRRQMRSHHPLGALLSGGLDSSSVCALAARALAEKSQRFCAFTGVPRQEQKAPDGCYGDETPFVAAIAKDLGNVDVNYVHDEENDEADDLQRCFVALAGPVRNPNNLGWMLGLLRQAQRQGRRVLLGGLHGNSTISWNGWSQAADALKRGRLLTALWQWRLYYRLTPYSPRQSLHRLFVAPLAAEFARGWALRRRRDAPAWQAHSPIRADFAAAMGVEDRARQAQHDFDYRPRIDERTIALTQVDYFGDWHAAEKSLTGVEVRDPTADIDVVAYCFGVPPGQYLAEGIDRSLIRRAMWGMLPEKILTNRLSGLQAAGWQDALDRRRGDLRVQIAALRHSQLAERCIDLARLERAAEAPPHDGMSSAANSLENDLALTRGLAAGRFLQWFESANAVQH